MAKFQEFGEIIEESPGFEEFGEIIESGEEGERVPIRTGAVGKDVAKQAALGLAEGAITSPGDILSLLGLSPSEVLPGEAAATEAQRVAPLEQLPALVDDDIIPRYSGLLTSEKLEGLLDLLGVSAEAETAPGRFAKRAASNIGAGALFGAGLPALAGLAGAGLAGQGVEEVAGPGAGLAAELLTLLGPGAFRAGPVTRKAKELASVAERRGGMAPSATVPLERGEAATRGLGKFAKKGKFAREAMAELDRGLGQTYTSIIEEGRELGSLTRGESTNLRKGIQKVRTNLGKSLKGTDKEKVIEAITDLETKAASATLNPGDLIDYFQEINSSINWKSVRGGKKRLAELKNVIGDSLKDASPELYRDFLATNELYGKFKILQGALKPTRFDDFLGMAEALPIFSQLAHGNIPGALAAAKYTAGAEVGRRALTRWMLSGRTQNKFKKVMDLTNKGKIQEAQVLARRIQEEMKRSLPDEKSEPKNQ